MLCELLNAAKNIKYLLIIIVIIIILLGGSIQRLKLPAKLTIVILINSEEIEFFLPYMDDLYFFWTSLI